MAEVESRRARLWPCSEWILWLLFSSGGRLIDGLRRPVVDDELWDGYVFGTRVNGGGAGAGGNGGI
jgi:hypothetical protein